MDALNNDLLSVIFGYVPAVARGGRLYAVG
jgi:hypothetical protein